jgi:hypothetical protein
MPLPSGNQPSIIPIAVQFGGPVLTITYAESKDQTPNVRDTITRDVDVEALGDEYDEFVETVLDLIDKAGTMKRNPPQTIRG